MNIKVMQRSIERARALSSRYQKLLIGGVLCFATLESRSMAGPNFADVVPAPKLPNPSRAEVSARIGGALPRVGAEAGKEVVIISLRGPFDFGNDWEGKAITALPVDLLLDIAIARKPAAVVLDVDSPGGYVTVMQQVIQRILEAQSHSKMRVIAWPNQAFSAAAVTCLACREIVVRPTTRMGAATKVIGNDAAPTPKSAMDNKVASVDEALHRQISQWTGRDPWILDAMEHPERVLSFSPASGFSSDQLSGAGVLLLDGSAERPMTLTSMELLTSKVAKGSATTVPELLVSLGLPVDTPICSMNFADPKLLAAMRPLTEPIKRWCAWRDKEFKNFLDAVKKVSTRIHDASLQVEALGFNKKWSDRDQEKLDRIIASCRSTPTPHPDLGPWLAVSGWEPCINLAFERFKDASTRAALAAKSRPGGNGTRVVDLEKAHSSLADAEQALQDLLKVGQ